MENRTLSTCQYTLVSCENLEHKNLLTYQICREVQAPLSQKVGQGVPGGVQLVLNRPGGVNRKFQ